MPRSGRPKRETWSTPIGVGLLVFATSVALPLARWGDSPLVLALFPAAVAGYLAGRRMAGLLAAVVTFAVVLVVSLPVSFVMPGTAPLGDWMASVLIALLIFTARYIPVGRIAVNMTAGATRYPFRRFLPLSIAAGVTWAAYSALFGILAGQWLHHQPLLAIVLAIAVAALAGVVVDAVIRRILDRTTGAADAEPVLESGRTAPDELAATARGTS